MFRLELEETIVSCLTSAPSICHTEIFLAKRTFLNVRPKLSYLGIFGLDFEKSYCIVVFYISTLKFFLSQNFN